MRRAVLLLALVGPLAADDLDPLLLAMDSADVPHRIDAAKELAERDDVDQRAIPFLVQGIRDDYWDVRRASTTALAKQGAAAVPALRESLDHEHYYPPIYAARALGRIGPDAADAAPDLLAQLRADDGQHRRWAAWALGRLGHLPGISAERVVAELERARDDAVVAGLCRVLAAKGEAASPAIPALIDLALGGEDAAARALGAIGEKAIAALRARLEEAELDRHAIWAGIGVLRRAGPAAAPALPWLIAEADPGRDRWFVAHVMRTFAAIGPAAADALPVVRRTVREHGYADARRAAIEALAAIAPEDPENVAMLQKALKDDAAEVREAAEGALQK